MDYSTFHQMFVDAMKSKTCWGAVTVRPLLVHVLDKYQEQHGTLPMAGGIVNIMTLSVAKKDSWGRNQLAARLSYAIQQVENRNA